MSCRGLSVARAKNKKKQKNNPVIEFKCADTTSLDFDIPRKIDRVSSAFSFPSCGRISAHEASCASRDAWVRRSSSLPGKGREVSGRLLCPQPCRRALFSTLGCVLRELVQAINRKWDRMARASKPNQSSCKRCVHITSSSSSSSCTQQANLNMRTDKRVANRNIKNNLERIVLVIGFFFFRL